MQTGISYFQTKLSSYKTKLRSNAFTEIKRDLHLHIKDAVDFLGFREYRFSYTVFDTSVSGEAWGSKLLPLPKP